MVANQSGAFVWQTNLQKKGLLVEKNVSQVPDHKWEILGFRFCTLSFCTFKHMIFLKNINNALEGENNQFKEAQFKENYPLQLCPWLYMISIT